MEASESKEHIGKLPGDDGWFRLASTRQILPWTVLFGLLLILLVPTAFVLLAAEIPRTINASLAVLYVVGLLAAATGCDRAVQLERIRRR